MTNFIKIAWKEIKPHFIDMLVLISLAVFIFFYIIYIPFKKSDGTWEWLALQNFILLLTIFFGWIQFLFYKVNKKKEAALTYFPKPLELEQLENEIDKVINFWSSNEPLEPYVVSLMVGEENVEECHYELIWNKFSIEVKWKIKQLFKDNSDNFNYKSKYKPWIRQELLNIRRKLNAYLNQIEAYCLSINTGNIDSKSAALLFNHKFKKHFNKSFPYIDKVRRLNNDKNLYIEFEKVVKSWDNL